MAEIRMYVNFGCPMCTEAKKFFDDRNITVETIEIGFDPLINAGIRAASNGQALPMPIIISWATQETIAGNDEKQLQRLADAALSRRPIAPNPSPN